MRGKSQVSLEDATGEGGKGAYTLAFWIGSGDEGDEYKSSSIDWDLGHLRNRLVVVECGDEVGRAQRQRSDGKWQNTGQGREAKKLKSVRRGWGLRG